MLTYNDKERISAEGAYAHEWIQSKISLIVEITKTKEIFNNLKEFHVYFQHLYLRLNAN